MPTTLYLDLETFCTVPIKHGTHAYAEKAEVMLVAFAWDAAPEQVWDLTESEQTSRDCLWALQVMIDKAETVVIQKSDFDRTVLRHQGVTIPVEKIDDTMVIALAHSLPASLDMLCRVFNIGEELAKSKEGKRLIHLFCKPRPKNVKLRRATRETHPAEWAEFIEYAKSDIRSMRAVRPLLPRWNFGPEERALWWLDQRINDRGVCVDVDLARAALRANERAQQVLARRVDDLTDGAVASATQRDVFKDHMLSAHGFEMANMQKGYIAEILKHPIDDPDIRELLEIRLQAAATAPAKYQTLLNGVSEDGRMRGILQYCGAGRTGRDAGRLIPQNMPRPTLSQEAIDVGIAAMKADVEDLV